MTYFASPQVCGKRQSIGPGADNGYLNRLSYGSIVQ